MLLIPGKKFEKFSQKRVWAKEKCNQRNFNTMNLNQVSGDASLVEVHYESGNDTDSQVSTFNENNLEITEEYLINKRQKLSEKQSREKASFILYGSYLNNQFVSINFF